MAFKQISTTGTIWEGKILSMAKHTEIFVLLRVAFFLSVGCMGGNFGHRWSLKEGNYHYGLMLCARALGSQCQVSSLYIVWELWSLVFFLKPCMCGLLLLDSKYFKPFFFPGSSFVYILYTKVVPLFALFKEIITYPINSICLLVDQKNEEFNIYCKRKIVCPMFNLLWYCASNWKDLIKHMLPLHFWF